MRGGEVTILKLFIRVLESGIAFALINAMVFAYYRTEQINKKRIVAALSLTLGFIAGVISVVIRSIPHLVNRANLDFYSVLPIVFSMLGLLVMIGLRKKWKGRAYENCMTAFVMIYVIGSHFYYLSSILMQTTSFVYYGESAVSTMVLYRIIGFALAVILMLVSASMVHMTARKLERGQVAWIAAISLLIMGVTQVNVIVQRLYSLKVIPKNRTLFQVIAFVSNHANLFYFLMMIFLAVIPIVLIARNLRLKGECDNRAQLRKMRYLMRHKRRIAGFLLCILAFNIFSLTYVKSYANREVPLSPPEPYEIVDGAVVLPLELFEDGLLHRYEYQTQKGVHVRFIVIKKAEGSYGVCLDACEICGPSGYFMRNEDVVCKLCDVVMNKGTIGFKGGCNPIPISYIVHDKKIKIFLEVLEESDYIFK